MPEYTTATIITILVVICIELFWFKTGIFTKSQYWLSLAIMFSFQILIDGWLTKLSDPIVIYNVDTMSGIRFPWDIPVEDFGFGFAMLTLTILIWKKSMNVKVSSQRDKKARKIVAAKGTSGTTIPRKVVVAGGGIAGIATAFGLAERGIEVLLVEPHQELGGRVRAWKNNTVSQQTTMSRGFHAFFKQYYNLREILGRAGNLDEILQPVNDYPVVSARGDRDSFTRIPRTPPWNFITFVIRSPTFKARDIVKVDIDTALSLLDVDFPKTYEELDSMSAAEFLDRLRFPDRARHLALEVFARSFFADPQDFSAGELVAMFHSYFLGSSEGLLFDVPRDDFDTTLWRPLDRALEAEGVNRVQGEVLYLEENDENDSWQVVLADGRKYEANGVVLAAGPKATPQIVAASRGKVFESPSSLKWKNTVEGVKLAPPFAVYRIWFDGKVNEDRPAFLGTADFGPLDNISVMERFEAGAAKWAKEHGGSVIELHAYAVPVETHGNSVLEKALAERLLQELERVYQETGALKIVAQEFLIERDCPLVSKNSWHERPVVQTPHQTLVLAGDWLKTDLPIALMERAATTGLMAANELLHAWGIQGHDLWSVPTRGRHWWPRVSRKLMKRLPGQRK